MRVVLPFDHIKAQSLLPEQKPDGSGVGINYADAMLKPVKLTLEDGRKLACKRRGLRITLSVGDRSGSGLLRRLEHGPDVTRMFVEALRDAATGAGATLHVDDQGTWQLDC